MTSRSSLWLALLLAVWAAPVAAQLNADFGGNTARVCVNSASGFDANLALRGPGNIASSMDAGLVTFNPDGTGTSSGSGLTIFYGASGSGATPAVEFDFTCSFTYTVSPSRVISLSSSCLSTALNGPGAGQQTEITNLVTEYELVDQNTTLVGTETTPNVETLTNLTSGFVSQRICHRASTRFVVRWGHPSS